MHALDSGFSREAGHDRFAQPVQPALVVAEHAVGFEHFAVLATVNHVAMLEQPVEVGAQCGNRRFKPLELFWDIIGDHIRDDDARLVQHDMAERDAVREDSALEMLRMTRRRFGAGAGEGG